jgi:ribosomal protein S18 acetylase RimI-like enzyme
VSGPQSPPIAPLDRARIGQATGVLARAFHEYPLFQKILPDEERRAKALVWNMGFIVRYCSTYGEVLSTAGDQAVITFLTGPHQFTRGRLLATGFLLGPLRMGLVPFWRMTRHNNHIAGISIRLVPPGAWYIWMLGVERAVRGQGLGWHLMNRVVETADAAGATCYCDTDRHDMLGFLSVHGFQVVHEGLAPADGSPFWILSRPPKPSQDRWRP